MKSNKNLAQKINLKTRPIVKDSKPDNNVRLIKAFDRSIDASKLPVVDQMFHVFFGRSSSTKKAEIRHRIGAWLGFVMGGIMPCGSYGVAHFAISDELTFEQILMSKWAAILTGLLLYSAPTVYMWAKNAFGSDSRFGFVKPLGFVVGLEGLMIVDTSAHIYLSVVSYTCLAILIFINAVSSGCQLVLSKAKK